MHAPLPAGIDGNFAELRDLAGEIIAGKRDGLVEVERVLRRDERAAIEGVRAGEGVATGILRSVQRIVRLESSEGD